MPGRSNRLCLLASLNELLGCLSFDSCMMLLLQRSLLFVVCFLCIFEDVDEMFTLFTCQLMSS